ncbi:HD domain-containing protein [Candidatus Dojkabacteria bacterium]|nr:HD domain-containing protein [Candidatus Dojkabacteria bacterium]
MPKTYYINQLETGQTLEDEQFGINSLKRALDKNNNPYLDIEFVDKTGTIKAKVWSDTLSRIDDKALTEGEIVEISASVREFNGRNQLTVYNIKPSEEKDLADYLPVTSKDIDELWKDFVEYVEKVEDKGIKKLLQALISTYEKEIKKNPAAKSVHHHYVGGLLEHVVEMLKISESVVSLYEEADKDLVIAGCILHDIGKIRELYIDGFQIDYTPEGKLVGHIPLGVKILNELLLSNGNKGSEVLDEQTRLKLEHIILSHHYVLEFGSPVTPKTIEAMIVSKIDDLSSKVRLVQKILYNNRENSSKFAPREFGLEGEVYLG